MLWEAVPTALAAAFSPWTLLIVAAILGHERPLRLALPFLGAAVLISFAIGFAFVEALSTTGFDSTRRHPTVPPALDIVCGIAVLAFAFFVARRPPREKRSRERELRVFTVVVLGLIAGSPSPLYLSSLHSLAQGHPSVAVGILEVLLIVVLVLLMAEIPIATFAAAPERTSIVLNTANAWLARHGRDIIVVVGVAAGCYFVVKGLFLLL